MPDYMILFCFVNTKLFEAFSMLEYVMCYRATVAFIWLKNKLALALAHCLSLSLSLSFLLKPKLC